MYYRRAYLVLLFVRFYFALSSSYIHPDENFQGPELLASRVFGYPSALPWEFTTSAPIRSVFPLWAIYGVPLALLQWLWHELGRGAPPPGAVYAGFRAALFFASFVFEDWAVLELVPARRMRQTALLLVASSYVTWTYQSHAFSNSIETIVVLWALVLMERVRGGRASVLECAGLAFVGVLGVFNRITFPAFVLIPALQLLTRFRQRLTSLLTAVGFATVFALLAIAADTIFYADTTSGIVISPLNSLRYNTNTANLSTHGLHPHYQHFLINLPQLLGPVFMLLLLRPPPLSVSALLSASPPPATTAAWTALTGIALLSLFPHQEARFLVPAVPLLLIAVAHTSFPCRPAAKINGKTGLRTLPKASAAAITAATGQPTTTVTAIGAWALFNTIMGFLMGVYHQGGVVPVQLAIPDLVAPALPNVDNHDNSHSHVTTTTIKNMPQTVQVFWWKTYPPPTWLIGNHPTVRVRSTDLRGMTGTEMLARLDAAVPACADASASASVGAPDVVLVAPDSAVLLDKFKAESSSSSSSLSGTAPTAAATATPPLTLRLLHTHHAHIGLDDLDIGSDGLIATVSRIVGRRGLSVWRVRQVCPPGAGGNANDGDQR